MKKLTCLTLASLSLALILPSTLFAAAKLSPGCYKWRIKTNMSDIHILNEDSNCHEGTYRSVPDSGHYHTFIGGNKVKVIDGVQSLGYYFQQDGHHLACMNIGIVDIGCDQYSY